MSRRENLLGAIAIPAFIELTQRFAGSGFATRLRLSMTSQPVSERMSLWVSSLHFSSLKRAL